MEYRTPTIEEMFQEAGPVNQDSVPKKTEYGIWIILGVGVVVISGILLYDHFCNSESFKSTYDDHDQN